MKLFNRFLKSANEYVMNDFEKLKEVIRDSHEADRFDDEEEWSEEEVEECAEAFYSFAIDSGYGTNHVNIARCLNLSNKLNTDNYGTSWTTPEHFYDFASENLPKKDLYCLLGYTTSDNIDWKQSAQLWQTFYYDGYPAEWELRLVDDTDIKDLDIKKVIDGELVELTIEDYKRIMG